MARIVVTGAAGFIGAALCRDLAARGHVVIGATRGAAPPIAGVVLRAVGDIGPRTDWSEVLAGAKTVVHLATRAHRSGAGAGNDEAPAASALARAAAAAGVRRLVMVSSIRAMGQATSPGAPFCAEDKARPADPYGAAKLAIEAAVAAAARDVGLDLVILRPPLVHGPGAKGNLRALLRLIASGLPLPLAGIENRRSLIFLDNLIDLIAIACGHPEAGGRVLLARDAADLSTPQLIRALAAGLDRPARLFTAPSVVFAALSRVPALAAPILRLTASLQVDDAETRRVLGWSPAVPSETGLAATARAFAQQRNSGCNDAGGVFRQEKPTGNQPCPCPPKTPN